MKTPKNRANRAAFASNGNVAGMVDPAVMERAATAAIETLLDALFVDRVNDPNTKGTARRVARMMVRETFVGRYTKRPKLTTFPNTKKLDEVYAVGPITVRSTCAHHLCPIEGYATIGVIPNGRLMGISKFSRLTTWVMARPQIQEDATVQLADEIEQAIRPAALGVIVTARHACMTWRGVREPSNVMTTSVMRGLFRTNGAARAELFAIAERHRLQCR